MDQCLRALALAEDPSLVPNPHIGGTQLVVTLVLGRSDAFDFSRHLYS